MSSAPPVVESFVLRFVHDASSDPAALSQSHWHGVVVHVQSNEEKNFSNIADAIAFISRYVQVGDFVFKKE